MTFSTLILGTAVAADVGKKFTDQENGNLYIGALVTGIGAIQLVFDWAEKARTHEFLHRDFSKLLSEVMSHDDPRTSTLQKWTARLIEIGADAPPLLRALDAVAYNEAADTFDSEPTDRLVVSFWRDLTKHWFSHSGHRFKRIGEA